MALTSHREIIPSKASGTATIRHEIVRCKAGKGFMPRKVIVHRRWQIWPLLRAKATLKVAILAALCTLALALAASRAAAQGCAMCYQNAAASGSQGQAALRHGILVLLAPAIAIFLGVFGLIYRRRNPGR